MDTQIEIKGNYKVIAGSTEWLKNTIENSTFHFSSTTHNEPCVLWKIWTTDGENKKVLKKKRVVAYIDAGTSDAEMYREYNNTRIIHTAGAGHYEAAMFEYLTLNASKYCNKLITMLADQLQKKVNEDKAELTIKVICE